MIELGLGPARVVWTDRFGGCSTGPYAEANLGDHVGDDPDAVRLNRDRLALVLELGPPGRWAWLHQVHGADVARFEDATPGVVPDADAAVTAALDLPLVVMTADCGSLALASDDAVAMVHVGWRGLLAGVVGNAVDALRSMGAGPVRAALGPCIRAANYEFGADDLATLVTEFGPTVAATTRWGTPALDVAAGIRRALERAGARLDHDVEECTVDEPRYFSHRRDGVTGRQVGLIVRPGPGSPVAFDQVVP